MTRPRRSAVDARRLILEAAEKQLTERGVDGVQVREVAQELGLVPATILHHFGSRDGLLTELMQHGARKLDERLDRLVETAAPDLERFAAELFELYGSRGYAELYVAISRARPQRRRRRPAFGPLLDAVRSARSLRTRRQRERAAEAVLALNLIAFADALVGRTMRRAVGLPADEASRARFRRFVGRLLDGTVDVS